MLKLHCATMSNTSSDPPRTWALLARLVDSRAVLQRKPLHNRCQTRLFSVFALPGRRIKPGVEEPATGIFLPISPQVSSSI